jgi:flavin-dependent dehydrogenase
VERRDVIIVGSGPAGAATGLRLAALAPALGAGTLLLEKAHHPREKTCAGGVIPQAVGLLEELGIALTVPHAVVDTASVVVPGRSVTLPGADICRVVRRHELDALLAWTARARGVELREGERVTHLARDGAGVRVETSRAFYWAPVVVGADGSGSIVRRALVPGGRGAVGRAVVSDVPVAAARWDGFAARRYEFDFTACATGLRGYRWVFPCLIDGIPHANVGVYALPPVDGRRLRAELDIELARLGTAPRPWRAFPIHTYARRAVVSAPHALLVGDAAGCDPLMGEGISIALEYGLLAARAIVDAQATGDWTFRRYARAVHRGPIGRRLRLLGLGARFFYGPRYRLWFRLAAASPRAQTVALDWYNGTRRRHGEHRAGGAI